MMLTSYNNYQRLGVLRSQSVIIDDKLTVLHFLICHMHKVPNSARNHRQEDASWHIKR